MKEILQEKTEVYNNHLNYEPWQLLVNDRTKILRSKLQRNHIAHLGTRDYYIQQFFAKQLFCSCEVLKEQHSP
jgi:hypothetical protein